MKKHAPLFAFFAALAAVGASCRGGGSGGVAPVPGAGSEIQAMAELGPDKPPSRDALLVLAGGTVSELPVQLETDRVGHRYEIRLSAHGEVLENEVYDVQENTFSLREAAGEVFEPPIPLLAFPMRIGDTLEWSGAVTIGDREHKARAQSLSQKDKIDVGGLTGEALQVQVSLSIEGGGPKPTTRQLSFWFIKDRGLVKREFGQASTRLPAQRTSPEE